MIIRRLDRYPNLDPFSIALKEECVHMRVEPTHRVLYRYVQVPEAVISRDLYSPPNAGRDPKECDLKLIYKRGLFHCVGLASDLMSETQAVAVRVLDIHFTVTPSLIRRVQIDRDTFSNQFSIQLIHIVNKEEDHASGDSIPRKRRNGVFLDGIKTPLLH
jgi:hypothetical protein